MKNNPLTPYWQSQGKDPSLDLDNVQIYLWAKGICISGHDAAGRLIQARSYQSQDIYDIEALESIIMNEPMLADALVVKNVWMAVTRNMLIPSALFNREVADKWFEQLYFVEHDEVLATGSMKDLGIKVVFPKKEKVRKIFDQYFPNRTSRFFISPQSLLKYCVHDKRYIVSLLFLENTCSITLFESQEMVFHKIQVVENAMDILVVINEYWEQSPWQAEVEILINGIVSDLNKWKEELAIYIPHVNNNPLYNTQTLLEELVICE